MFLQSFVRFHQGLFKILRKQNVSDTLSFGRTDNVKTVYPPTNIVCRGYNYSNQLEIQTEFVEKSVQQSNNVDPDQTAPVGAV